MNDNMTISSRTSSLQAYTLLAYRGPLHPEFFRIEDRRRLAYGLYEFESWLFRGGHVLRFEFENVCVTEVVAEQFDHLPQRGLAVALPCAGEKDHEAMLSDRINFITAMQTETLSDHLYLATYNEMIEHGRENDCPMVAWDDAGKPNLSLLDSQRYTDEIHLQSYHLRSDCGLVLRTQTIFQVKPA
jgi:hypothetical protein